MARGSGSFLKLGTIAQAERLVTRGLSLGGITMCAGGFLKIVSWGSPLGFYVASLGVAILLGTFVTLAFATRSSAIKKDCPRCNKTNLVFPREAYYKCSFCGYFAILHER